MLTLSVRQELLMWIEVKWNSADVKSGEGEKNSIYRGRKWRHWNSAFLTSVITRDVQVLCLFHYFLLKDREKGRGKNPQEMQSIVMCAVQRKNCVVEPNYDYCWRSGSRCLCLILQPLAQRRSCVCFWITSFSKLQHHGFNRASRSLTVSSKPLKSFQL